MSSVRVRRGGAVDESNESPRVPRLLYFCDFPPANSGGGAVLIARLLRDYPRDRLSGIVGSTYARQFRAAPAWTGARPPIVFPTSTRTGRRGLGRLRELMDWLLIPVAALVGAFAARRAHSALIFTVAHGHLFVAAALTSWLTRLPLVVVVHDDWAAGAGRGRLLARSLARQIFRLVLRRAATVYSVSAEMSEYLQQEFEVASDLLLPSTDRETDAPAPRPATKGPFRIVFSGTLTGPVIGGLQALGRLVGDLRVNGRACELHLHSPAGPDDLARFGLMGANVVAGAWVPQEELHDLLACADLLVAPYSFDPRYAAITDRSFPSKLADYMAAGRPLLVIGPADSPAVRYARLHECAEIVDTPDEGALRQALERVLGDPVRQEWLAAAARGAFRARHDAGRQRRELMATLSRLATRENDGP